MVVNLPPNLVVEEDPDMDGGVFVVLTQAVSSNNKVLCSNLCEICDDYLTFQR